MVLLDQIQHQAPMLSAVRNAQRLGKIAHAFLFWGPGGVGKLRAAQAMAQLLLCRESEAPCGVCAACDQVVRFVHPDLHLVLAGKPDDDAKTQKRLEAYGQDLFDRIDLPANASIVIDRIRNLKSETAKAHVESGNRVAIIRDAERMTIEAAQSALKLIEEPRDATYLILTCREPEALLPTILSRCQRIRFRPLPAEFIKSVIAERAEAAAPLEMISRLSQGSLGRALGMLEEDVASQRDLALSIFASPLGDPQEVREKVHLVGRKWDLGMARTLVDMLMLWYEDQLMLQHGLPESGVAHQDRVVQLRVAASTAPHGELKRRIGILEEMLQALGQNVNPTLALETTLLRLNGLVAEKGYR
jgi:DNA polymerase III subunit delta'